MSDPRVHLKRTITLVPLIGIEVGQSIGAGVFALARFWFNTRYLFTAILPGFFLLFALEYSDSKRWHAKHVLVWFFALPILTHYALANHKPRKLKRLYDQRQATMEALVREYFAHNK